MVKRGYFFRALAKCLWPLEKDGEAVVRARGWELAHGEHEEWRCDPIEGDAVLEAWLCNGEILGVNSLVDREANGGELLHLPSCVDAPAVVYNDTGPRFLKMLGQVIFDEARGDGARAGLRHGFRLDIAFGLASDEIEANCLVCPSDPDNFHCRVAFNDWRGLIPRGTR